VQQGKGQPCLGLRVVRMDQIVKGRDHFVHEGVQSQ
jgi:hypothetical protein